MKINSSLLNNLNNPCSFLPPIITSCIYRIGDNYDCDNCYYEKSGNIIINISDEIPYEIPSNWAWSRIKQICIVKNGATPRRDNKEFWINGTIPWFTIDDKHDQGLFINKTRQHITEIALSKDRIVPANSILLCCTASVGEVAYTNIDITTNQQFNGLTIRNEYNKVILPLYLLIFASTLKKSLRTNLATATTFGFVSVSKVENILIPLPPLDEQKRMIEKYTEITKYLEKIEYSYASLNRMIEVTKQKVLNSFFGQNSSYKSYYRNRAKTTLSELIPKDKIGDGDWVLSENMDEKGEFSLVQLKHIGRGKYINKSYNHINSDFFATNNCTEIKSNYLLINRLVANDMNVCLLPKINFKCITSVDVCWIAPSESYNQKYLMYYMLSPEFQSNVKMKCSGSTRKRISKTNLVKIEMFIHDIKYQEIIVDEIDKMFRILDSIIS